MIKYEYFTNLEEAFESNMKKDYDHVLIRHAYLKGRRIHPHIHEVDEWVIATHGHFVAESEGETQLFNLDGDKVLVIYYPAGVDHGLTVIGDVLEYFVMRN